MPPRTLTIPRRFNGPPTSGNGGYVAGLVTLSTLLGVLSLPFALGVLGGLKF